MGLIPVEHAWIMDAEGFAIDPTWNDKARGGSAEYFGVPFRRKYVQRIFRHSGCEFSLIDNLEDGFPLRQYNHDHR